MWCLSLFLGVLLLMGLAWLWLYFTQDSLIFFPRGMEESPLAGLKMKSHDLKEIRLKMQDRTKLHGWFLKDGVGKNTHLLIYFGGNAEEVSWLVGEMGGRFPGWSVTLINYRGYGLSEGKPGEKKLSSDALEIYDYFTKRENLPGSRVVAMGRSLGTGIAVYLAHEREVGGLVLVSPYDSLSRVAQKIYPWVPVGLLLKHKFDSLALAPSIRVPLLALATPGDLIVPISHTRELVKRWGGPARLVEILGADHDSISTNDLYWKEIGDFLKSRRGN